MVNFMKQLGQRCQVTSADLRFRVAGTLRQYNDEFLVDRDGEACAIFAVEDVDWSAESTGGQVLVRLKAGLTV